MRAGEEGWDGLLLRSQNARGTLVSNTGAGDGAMKQIGRDFLITGWGLGPLDCISKMSIIGLGKQ